MHTHYTHTHTHTPNTHTQVWVTIAAKLNYDIVKLNDPKAD